MTLPNLVNSPDTTDMTALKKWREIRSNSRDTLIAKNQNRASNVDCTAGGIIELSVTLQEENIHLRLTGTPGGAYTVEFADGNKQMLIENASGQTATIETATGATTPPTIVDGGSSEIQIRGTDITVNAGVSLEVGALLHGGGVDPTGDQNWADFELKGALLFDTAYVVDTPSSSSNVLNLDCENGNWFDVTLTEDVNTLNILNPAIHFSGIRLEDGSGELILEDGSGKLLQEENDAVANVFLITTQDGSGGHSFTFPATFVWDQSDGITNPSLSTGPNEVDIWWFFKLVDNVWFAHQLGINMG